MNSTDITTYSAAPSPMTWKKSTFERYWQMLEMLPPAAQTGNGFLVGEPVRHDGDGRALYTAFWQQGDAYFESAHPMSVASFRSLVAADVTGNVVEPIIVYRTVTGELARVLVPVKEIVIIRAEGPTALCGKPQRAGSWIEANTILRQNARTAPKGGAYDKHDFTVTFDDGETYQGRYDLHFEGPYDLAGHVRDMIGYLAGTWTGYREGFDNDRQRDEVMSRYRRQIEAEGERTRAARAWLLRYDVEQAPQIVPPGAHVEVAADFLGPALAYPNASYDERQQLLAQHGELKLAALRRLRETYTVVP